MAGSHHQDQEAATITIGGFPHGVEAPPQLQCKNRSRAVLCSVLVTQLCCLKEAGESKVQQQPWDEVCLQPLEMVATGEKK